MMKDFLKRFAKKKLSVAAFFVLLLFIFIALFGPALCRYDPLQQDLKNIYAGISREHWLGTDNLGRDTLTRLVYGARVSLGISFSGVLSGCVAGVLLGVCAGYFGRWIDTVICRLIDVMLAFPGLLLAIVISAVLGNGVKNTALAVSIFSVPSIARMVRSVVLGIKNREYIQACQIVGESHARIIFTHIIPNAMSQIIVNTTLNLGSAILTASSLSFLGMGVQPPDPEWGTMLNNAMNVIRTSPIGVVMPGICITLVVLSFSLLGDGLRDALDPKLKNV